MCAEPHRICVRRLELFLRMFMATLVRQVFDCDGGFASEGYTLLRRPRGVCEKAFSGCRDLALNGFAGQPLLWSNAVGRLGVFGRVVVVIRSARSPASLLVDAKARPPTVGDAGGAYTGGSGRRRTWRREDRGGPRGRRGPLAEHV